MTETIESVIGQEGDFFIEYIIVDGGSTDSSVDIIRYYQSLLDSGAWPIKCRGVSYLWESEKDNGQTDALSKGFRQASGSVLAWLNSDDSYLPGTLQAITSFFLENLSISLLYGKAYYSDTAGNSLGRYPTQKFDSEKLSYFNFFCQPSTFFRREAFDAVGGLDPSLHFAMDYDLFIRISQRFTSHYLPQYCSKYRLHEGSKTVRIETLFQSHEETLRLSLKYFNWAPLTLVYGSSNYYCLSRLPRPLTNFRPIAICAALACTLFRSLLLNRGIRKNDLHLLTFANIRKLFNTRKEILLSEDKQ